MEVKIEATEEERAAVVDAIRVLCEIPHIKQMSMALIAQHANIKETKVRAAIIELIAEGRITQYPTTENERLQRFYYLVNPVAE